MIAFYIILIENDKPALLQEKASNEEEAIRKPLEIKQDVAIENKASNSGCLGILLLGIILTIAFI